MNTPLSFTVTVTGCKNCPLFDRDDMCESPLIQTIYWRKAVDVVRQNKDQLTNTCPMIKTKESETK